MAAHLRDAGKFALVEVLEDRDGLQKFGNGWHGGPGFEARSSRVSKLGRSKYGGKHSTPCLDTLAAVHPTERERRWTLLNTVSLSRTGRAMCAIAIVCGTSLAHAQGRGPRWAPEARADVFAARTTALHGAIGANIIIGNYVRIGMLAGAGSRRIDSVWRASGRADLVARFHVDPFGESRWGAYAGGGATYFVDRGVPGRARAVVVIGVEGPPARHWMTGIELGLGGGARVGVTLRRARTIAR